MSDEIRRARPNWALLLALVGVLLLVPLVAGCSARSTAQTTTPTPTQASAPTASGSPQLPAPSTTAVFGTPTVRPTPSGPPPTPENLLNIFNVFPSGDTLVRRDSLQLDKDATLEILFTITGPGDVVTSENRSAIGVVDYDPKYREWNLVWSTSSTVISGTASPLPAANRVDGYNGGDLLRTGASMFLPRTTTLDAHAHVYMGTPIFLLRTTTLDGHAHLNMWRWDSAKREGVPLKMVPVGGGAEQDAAFEGDLDVNVADLDGDGKYEVIADNLAGVQTWKWDGSKYAPEAKR